MTSAVRTPAVAGRFYPAHSEQLLREVREYTSPPQPGRVSAIGCVAPHAGYIYSGRVAGAVFSRLEIPTHCIILCPNHTGKGVPLAIMTASAWQTPLGVVAVSELGSRLLQRFPALEENSAAHQSEHAIEVQLPFLQAARSELQLGLQSELKSGVKIVPIAIGTRNFEVLRLLGEALADVVGEWKEKVLIIASSDMNHYEPDPITRIKDHKAIERVLALDAAGLSEVVTNEEISMCGVGPTIAMLTAANRLGATRATLAQYATSGDVSGDRDAVVGYAGIIIQ